MCKIAFLKFSEKTMQKDRQVILRRVLINSWDLGNSDGAGIYMFDNSCKKEKLIKSVQLGPVLEDLSSQKEIFDNVIVHTRLATNKINYQNTQPLTSKSVILAHNGVVHTWEKWKLKMQTTNDSEIILRLWEKYGNIKEVNERLGGNFNYILLDKGAEKLYLNSNDEPLFMRQQDGNIFVYQNKNQLEGVLTDGLYAQTGFDILRNGYYIELPISEDMFKSFKKKKYFAFKQFMNPYTFSPYMPYGVGIRTITPQTKWDAPDSNKIDDMPFWKRIWNFIINKKEVINTSTGKLETLPHKPTDLIRAVGLMLFIGLAILVSGYLLMAYIKVIIVSAQQSMQGNLYTNCVSLYSCNKSMGNFSERTIPKINQTVTSTKNILPDYS